MAIKKVRHALMGIALSPRGAEAGGKSVDEINALVSQIAVDYDEVTMTVIQKSNDEKGETSYVLNEYFFVKYDEAPVAKSKKADA
jgi:hypothetical protein